MKINCIADIKFVMSREGQHIYQGPPLPGEQWTEEQYKFFHENYGKPIDFVPGKVTNRITVVSQDPDEPDLEILADTLSMDVIRKFITIVRGQEETSHGNPMCISAELANKKIEEANESRRAFIKMWAEEKGNVHLILDSLNRFWLPLRKIVYWLMPGIIQIAMEDEKKW